MSRRRDVVALVLYSLLTVGLAWALVSDIDTALAGHNSDVQMNLWADWWTKKVLTERLNLFHTDYLFYPQGVSLAFHSFSHVNTLISLVLRPITGRIAAYNVPILLSFALSGFSMYLLVKHLTGSALGAFGAGLVFAFQPYHRFESAHPVIVTTQWMPLFALALMRTIHGTERRRNTDIALTALWFVLTALSSWHLMLMLAGWTVLYLTYDIIVADSDWAPGARRSLVIAAVVAGVVLSPFLWPMVSEALGPGISHMSADPDDGIGNDLLAFMVPNEENPVLYPLASRILDVNDTTGFTGKRSAYLGYVALALAVAGVSAAREARFWGLAGLLSLLLSVGARVTLNGTPLHGFYLPWALPAIRILRHPFRLNVLTFFSLSVAAGFGLSWVHGRIASRRKTLACAGSATLMALMLVEYMVVPFPTMEVTHSPFLLQLAEEQGDFAVADFPMGRQNGKHYMYCQTIHGKRIAGGHVSRKPDSADAFIDGNPLLEQLDDNAAPGPEVDIESEFQKLAARGFRYLIIHKSLLESEDASAWKSWFPFQPSYEDQWLIVYPVPAEAALEIDGEERPEANPRSRVQATRDGRTDG